MECRPLFPPLLRLKIPGELDHLAPLLGFVGDELAEVGRREREHRDAEFSKLPPANIRPSRRDRAARRRPINSYPRLKLIRMFSQNRSTE